MSQVLLEMKQLLLQFAKSSEGDVITRMLLFLNAQGFKQHFEERQKELQECLVQLSTVLNVVQVKSQVGAVDAADTHPDSSHSILVSTPIQHPVQRGADYICQHILLVLDQH
jgi:hypothetical protein